jgi:hypothetical protein
VEKGDCPTKNNWEINQSLSKNIGKPIPLQRNCYRSCSLVQQFD